MAATCIFPNFATGWGRWARYFHYDPPARLRPCYQLHRLCLNIPERELFHRPFCKSTPSHKQQLSSTNRELFGAPCVAGYFKILFVFSTEPCNTCTGWARPFVDRSSALLQVTVSCPSLQARGQTKRCSADRFCWPDTLGHSCL